ncbi:MAG TPA: YaeQ family protein, partial [Geomonas sp.]
MALPSTVYRASVQLSDLDRQVYEQLQTTIVRHPSETAERLVARLLAYALCFEEGLSFTKGVGSGDEPDLWSKGPDGRVKLWIEVGLPDPDRLAKSCRHVERAVLFACGPAQTRSR